VPLFGSPEQDPYRILYLGSSEKDLRRRCQTLTGALRPETSGHQHTAAWRLKIELGLYDPVLFERFVVCLFAVADAHRKEKELLRLFWEQHGRRPPLNRLVYLYRQARRSGIS
jgi:hypothetical protein